MTRLIILFTGILLGGILMFFGFHYHVVKTETTQLVIPKQHTELSHFYVDIRDWDAQKWSENPHLIDSVTAAGHADLVVRSFERQLLDQLIDTISGREKQQK